MAESKHPLSPNDTDQANHVREKLDGENIVCLFEVGFDAEGNMSLAMRDLDTGEDTTWSDNMKRTLPGPDAESVRRTLRVVDSEVCWMLSGNLRPGFVRNMLMVLSIPLFVTRLGIGIALLRLQNAREQKPGLLWLVWEVLKLPFSVLDFWIGWTRLMLNHYLGDGSLSEHDTK